jgi:MSHA biogenesis protein MshP
MWTTCPDRSRRSPRRRAGFTLVSALFVLVVLAALGTALASISLRQHMGSAAEIDAARAWQTARSGLEWAAWQVLQNPPPPAAAPGCFAATSFALGGFTVSVSCERTPASGTLDDGGQRLVFYRLRATACQPAPSAACPESGNPPETYVERQLEWTVTR